MLNFLLFLPLGIFATIIFINPESLMIVNDIGPIFGYVFSSTLLQLISIGLIVYMLVLYIYIMSSKVSHSNKIESLEKEIIILKSDLYSEQGHLLEKLITTVTNKIEHLEKSSDAKLERVVKFNEYTLDKIIASTQGDFDKYKKETSKILKQAEIQDKTLLEKIKVWEK